MTTIKKSTYIFIVFALIIQLINAQTKTSVSDDTKTNAVKALIRSAEDAIEKGEFKDSFKYLASASEMSKDPAIVNEINIAKAYCYLVTGNIVKSNNLLKKINQPEDLRSSNHAKLLLLQAELNVAAGEFSQVDKQLAEAAIIIKEQNETKLHYRLTAIKGKSLTKQNYPQDALPVLNEIAVLNESEISSFYKIQNSINYAEAHKSLNNIALAQEYANEAVALSQKGNLDYLTLRALTLKRNIAELSGDYKTALNIADTYAILKEKLNPNTANSNSSFEPVIPEDEKIAELQGRLKGRDTSTLLLFILLTLLSLLTLSLFKNNKLRANTNVELESKNMDLMTERDRAKDAAKIKADFLSTITHELRTPMYAVTGLTHLLIESNPKTDQVEHLQTLQSSGEYLLSLIDNILDFNKLEANKVELESIPFSLEKRIRDLTVSLSGQAQDNGNQLLIEYDIFIPSRVKGDPVKISQILINLIGNAIKFTKNGNIWIRSNMIQTEKNKCLVRFEIEDNGKGISDDKQQLIFENFSQEEASTTREFGGTGLGLAIVKNLVELMGGRVSLDSKLHRGSIFSFEIWFELVDSNSFMDERRKTRQAQKKLESKAYTEAPKNFVSNKENSDQKTIPAEVKAPMQTPVISNENIITKKSIPVHALGSKRILIVEDNKINQMITRKILEGKNILCDVANDGIEAIEKVKMENFDLILMDIHMPNMDGKIATKQIRTFNSEIPIIALTAVTLNESEEEFYELGFDDIIPKPFKMDIFFAKIEKVFSNYEIM